MKVLLLTALLLLPVALHAQACRMAHDPDDQSILWASKGCEHSMLATNEKLDTTKVAKVIDGVKMYVVRDTDATAKDTGAAYGFPTCATGALCTSGTGTYQWATNVTITSLATNPQKCYAYEPKPDITLYELALVIPFLDHSWTQYIGTGVPMNDALVNYCFSGQQWADAFTKYIGTAIRHFKEKL